MDPYPVRDRKFPVDPYHSPINFRILTIKVIPVKEAKVFPSWKERKLVWLELIFDPFTLEVVIVLHEGQNVGPKQRQSEKQGTEPRIVISPSYFIPVMDSENQLYIVLHRAMGVQDKLLACYENPSPTSQGTLTSKIAERILAALTALGKEKEPLLELCFQNTQDASSFIQAWLLAFGRRVSQSQQKKGSAIGSHRYHPNLLNHLGTPVSLQTPTNARNLILPPLVYEKFLLSSESKASTHETALENLKCHSSGNGTAESPYFWEVFIPYDKLQECKVPEYYKIHWRAQVSWAMNDNRPVTMQLKVEDQSIRMLREPLLPAGGRKEHLGALKQSKKVDEWIEGNEKEQYWCLKLLAPVGSLSKPENRPGEISIVFLPKNSQLNEAINCGISFARGHPSFDPRQALAIQEIFLGHRLGRLLSDDILKQAKMNLPRTLSTEQANIFSHVLNHDFTLVDGAPGTGKSRVTAEIIAGFVLQRKQVLVMTASNAALDFLVLSVLDTLPSDDIRNSEMITRLVLQSQIPNKRPRHKETTLESVSVNIAHMGGPHNPKEKVKIERATAIFMTIGTALQIDRSSEISKRVFDLIVLDDANTVSESLALQLTGLRFANAFRWLVIGCSKGISPTANIEEFEEIEICSSWFKRLLRHPEFRLNPLRLMEQYRSSKALYNHINRTYFNNTITMSPGAPTGVDDELCMGFINSARVCKPKRGRSDYYDEELFEMANYRKEQSLIFHMAQKICKLTPHASIVILCYCESQKKLMATELSRAHNTGSENSLSKAAIIVATIDGFSSNEADYAIVHVPLWKDSYEHSADHGRFVIAMTRARKGVFVVGNLKVLIEYEESEDAWAKNPWNGWVLGLKNSRHGAIFEDVAEVDLKIKPKPFDILKRGRAEFRS